MDSPSRLTEIAEALSIPRAERHIFLCADQTNPKCAPREVTHDLWVHLKNRLKALGLSTPPPPWQSRAEVEATPAARGTGTVLRSKVDCLRICEQGGIAVVYPDGVWYAGLDREKLDRVIDEHLIGGNPVEDFVFARGAPW